MESVSGSKELDKLPLDAACHECYMLGNLWEEALWGTRNRKGLGRTKFGSEKSLFFLVLL